MLDTTPPSADPFTGLPLTNNSVHLLNLSVDVEFNGDMNTNSFTSANIELFSSVRGLLATTVSPLSARRLRVQPVQPFVAGESVTVTLTTALADTQGRALDGNGNGIADGLADQFQWAFTVTNAAQAVTIARDGVQVEVTWPMQPYGPRVILRQGLEAATPWISATNPPVMSLGRWKLRVPLDSNRKFIRLEAAP